MADIEQERAWIRRMSSGNAVEHDDDWHVISPPFDAAQHALALERERAGHCPDCGETAIQRGVNWRHCPTCGADATWTVMFLQDDIEDHG